MFFDFLLRLSDLAADIRHEPFLSAHRRRFQSPSSSERLRRSHRLFDILLRQMLGEHLLVEIAGIRLDIFGQLRFERLSLRTLFLVLFERIVPMPEDRLARLAALFERRLREIDRLFFQFRTLFLALFCDLFFVRFTRLALEVFHHLRPQKVFGLFLRFLQPFRIELFHILAHEIAERLFAAELFHRTITLIEERRLNFLFCGDHACHHGLYRKRRPPAERLNEGIDFSKEHSELAEHTAKPH